MAGTVLRFGSSMPGVRAAASAMDPEADLAACKALLRDGSRTFLAASMLLPAQVRDPACALYAFCRLADDAVDVPGAASRLAVPVLQQRLSAMYAGRPIDSPADRALAAVVRQFAVPRGLLEALLEGFAWDHAERRYQTIEELLDYAARVAGTVGAVMALLMGVRSREAVARACELGCAMQLSNIARDVGEDARMGRIYLPLDWLHEAGIDVEDWLARPTFTPAIAHVTERLLRTADELYARVGSGVALLPLACRPGINAARFLYAEIGQQVRRNGLDSVSRRAVVPRGRKLVLLLRAAGRVPIRQEGDVPRTPLPATRFLLEMLPEAPLRVPSVPQPDLSWSTARIIEMFERQERRRLERHGVLPGGRRERSQGSAAPTCPAHPEEAHRASVSQQRVLAD